MNEREIIDALIARDERVTQQFFFQSCRPLFLSIIRYVFSYEVDYDEFVGEFYLYLMENDAHRLRQFEGRSTIYQWLKIVAIRYFVAKRDKVIDMQGSKPLLNRAAERSCAVSSENLTDKIDVEHLLSLMPNRRFAFVVRRLILQDAEPQDVAAELGVSVDNLYNIKRRAVAALTAIALNEVDRYEGKSVK